MRTLHVINSLRVGGAEQMLVRLLQKHPMPAVDTLVLTLRQGGPLEADLMALGVPVISLGLFQDGWQARWREARNQCIAFSPDVVHAWMYHSMLFTIAARRWFSDAALVWGVHHSNLGWAHNSLSAFLSIRAVRAFSSQYPDTIVYCAEAARGAHEALGFDRRRSEVIPNGFDTTRFGRTNGVGFDLRQFLGVSEETTIIGHVGRYDPMKDHATLLASFGEIKKRRPNVHLVPCGAGVTADNAELQQHVGALGANPRVHLLGHRTDVPSLMTQFDLLVSSSVGEAFPNVLGEAMLSEVPCIVTDVGDCALIVGETGWVVPPRQPKAMAEALGRALDLPVPERRTRGREARARIEHNFSIERVAEEYGQLHRRVASDSSARVS